MAQTSNEGSFSNGLTPSGLTISHHDALAILQKEYGSNSITVEKGNLKIQDWQAAKKIEHAVCFGINPSDYDISQKQLREINKKGGIVAYVQKGKELPSRDLIKAYQYSIKSFCEDPNSSVKNDQSTFQGEPSITFFDKKTKKVVIFNRKENTFISAYKINKHQAEEYEKSHSIGKDNSTKNEGEF